MALVVLMPWDRLPAWCDVAVPLLYTASLLPLAEVAYRITEVVQDPEESVTLLRRTIFDPAHGTSGHAGHHR